MRARTCIPIACLSAFTLAAWGGFTSRGQAPAPASPVPAQQSDAATQDSANELLVSVGKSVLVDCAHPIERIAVGSGDLAEVTAISPTEIMLNGKAPGETSLIVWQQGGIRQFFNVEVRASSYATNDRLDSLRRELRTELPGQILRVTSENGLVFLRGTVKRSSTSSDRAVQIASVPPAKSSICSTSRFLPQSHRSS